MVKKIIKKQPLRVSLVDSITNDVIVIDVSKLDKKNKHMKGLIDSIKDAIKSNETIISVHESCMPGNLDYKDYAAAEVLLPSKIDAVLITIRDT